MPHHHGMRLLSLSVLALALTGIPACSRTPAPPLDPSAVTSLRVENQAFLDMNIYVVYHGQRIRVGTATGSRTTIFRLPINITTVESLQFIADPIGSSRAPVSDEILVSPGDVVTLTIPPQ